MTYYEIMFNGQSTVPKRSIPEELITKLTKSAEAFYAKIAVHPKGGFLYSMYLYNLSSHNELDHFYTQVIEAVRSSKLDVICSTLHSGHPPLK